MKKGQSHKWKYKNLKTKDTGKRITMYQVKKRGGGGAPKGSGMPKGSKLHWGINATETYKRIGRNKYRVTIQGTKTQKGYTLTKKGKYKRPKH